MKYRRSASAFSLLEIVIAAAILALAFIPILNQSQSVVQSTGESQESILARHFLVDLVERYRGSSIAELQALLPPDPPTTPIPLGQDPEYIRKDSMLNDIDRVSQQMQTLAAAGYHDGGEKGYKKFVDIKEMVQLTREVYFKDIGKLPSAVDPETAPSMYRLLCRVRWKPRNGPGEKSAEMTKIMIQ